MANRSAALAQLHAILASDSPSSVEHASRQREALSLEALSDSDDSHESNHPVMSSSLAQVSRSHLFTQQPATSRTQSLPAHASEHVAASVYSSTLARAATSALETSATTRLPLPSSSRPPPLPMSDANTEAASSDGAHKLPALENKRRCAGLTRLKTQCSRYSDAEYCYQHAGTVEASAPRQAPHSAPHGDPSSFSHPIASSSTIASSSSSAPTYATAAVSVSSGGSELPNDHHSAAFSLRVSRAIADDELFLSREFGNRFDSTAFESDRDFIAAAAGSDPVRSDNHADDETFARGHIDADDDEGLDAHDSIGVAQELVLLVDDDSFIDAEELGDFDDYDGGDDAWRDPSPRNDLGFDNDPRVDQEVESRSDSLHPHAGTSAAGTMLVGPVSSEYHRSAQVEQTGSLHIQNSHDINEHAVASSFPAFPSFAKFSAHTDSSDSADTHLQQDTVPNRDPLNSFVIESSSSSSRRLDDPAVSHSDVSSLLSHMSDLSRLTSGDPLPALTNPPSMAHGSVSFAAAADLYSASAFGASDDHRPSPSRRRISLPRPRASPLPHRAQTPTRFSSASAISANDDESVQFNHINGGGMSIVKGANYLHVSHTNHASPAASSTALPVASDSALFDSAVSSHSASPLSFAPASTSDSPPSPSPSLQSSAHDHALASMRRLPLLRASLAHWRTLLVRRRHHERLAAQLGNANATSGALRAWRAALGRRIRIKV
jgi:hypothetical protein